MKKRLYLALLVAALAGACGGGGDSPPAAPAAAPPALLDGTVGQVTLGPLNAGIGSPYGGTGETPPGPEGTGITLLAGRARPTEQGRGVLDGSVRFTGEDFNMRVGGPEALQDGSLLVNASHFANGTWSGGLARLEMNGRMTSLRGPWDRQIACEPFSACMFERSAGRTVGRDGRIYASSTADAALYIVEPDLRTYRRAAPFPTFAQNFAADAEGNLYFEGPDRKLWLRRADGTMTSYAVETGPTTISAMTTDAAGHVWYATSRIVRMFDPRLGLARRIAGADDGFAQVDGALVQARFHSISGIAVAQDGSIYLRDRQTVRKIAPDGTVSTILGRDEPRFPWIAWGGQLPGWIGSRGPGGGLALLPGGIAFDASNGEIGTGPLVLFARYPH